MKDIQITDLLEDKVFMATFHADDPSILKDLPAHRSEDCQKLLRRCSAISRNLSPVQDVPRIYVEQYLACLVYCYFQCADSIKISRAVEKLWQPYMETYSACIHTLVEGRLMSVIQSRSIDNQSVVRVSVLLEQSRVVQHVVRQHLDLILGWLSDHVCSLTLATPDTMSTAQSQLLYAFVKMCLQMFQVCPSRLGYVIWSSDWGAGDSQETTPLYTATCQLIECLVYILRSKGYHTDCVLLCGTAMALILNTATTAHGAFTAFNWLLGVILDPGVKFVFSQLTNVSNSSANHDIRSRLRGLTSNHMGAVSLIRGIVACGSEKILLTTCTAESLVGEDMCTTDLCVKSLTGSVCDTCTPNTKGGPSADVAASTGASINSQTSTADCGGNDNDTITPTLVNQTISTTQVHMERLFEYICILCEGDITLHYHSSQILLLWYSRLTKLTSSMESVPGMNFTSILESTVRLVQLHWDSPVEDVAQAVVDVFGHVMSLGGRDQQTLAGIRQQILAKIVQTHWHIKGRYKALAVLLKYVDSAQLLQDYPVIQEQLLQCLTTNHLASSATNVYKAFLVELQNVPTEAALARWKEDWLPAITRGLVANDSLLRYNTSLHWVPASLRQLPPTSSCLLDHFTALLAHRDPPTCRTRALHAWLVMAKTTRTLTGDADLTDPLVIEALYCGDEDVRSAAISLVCSTVRKAECVSAIEVSLLKTWLPDNMKIDSAPFRQHLGSNIRKLLVRLRDSCIPLLKSPEENTDKLSRSMEFVDWLHGLCMDCLLPGASYQRRKGSLDLLHVLYEALIYRPDSRQRKGFTPEAAVSLVTYSTSRGCWHFFCADNMTSLIHCLLDSADEIQSSAASLLSRYYCWPLGDHVGPPPRCCHLLAEALRLCNNPRGHDSQSGAVLCKLIYQKYCVEGNVRIDFQHDSTFDHYAVMPGDECEPGATCFLNNLLTEIQWCQVAADSNMVDASKRFPIHGFICAITRCLTETAELWVCPDPQLVTIVYEVMATCRDVTDSMLAVMVASVAGQEASPSFAEIGVALESLLEEQGADYAESTSVTPAFQYLLAWCWTNIKESCLGLAELTWTLVTAQAPLRCATIEDISRTFLSVLTKCRHKGVIEACRTAFIRFCSALFHTSDTKLAQLPLTILTQVLTSLKKNAMASSVTRQSAGLPIIIQAVLVSEHKTKKTVLLTHAISELFEISCLPLDEDSGLTDLPQVHGLNMLNTLFSDASLSATLMGHVMQSVILVIQKFGSPSWAIRNAATKFFSTLVTRIFGQKSCTDGFTQNSVTFQEFSAYYPELPPFIETSLTTAAERDIRAIEQIHPELFPVLTLLSCLKPMDTTDHDLGNLRSIKDKVEQFLASPVYQLRHLVAGALVAMVTRDHQMTVAMSVVREDMGVWTNTNRVHGALLLVERLLDHIDSAGDIQQIWDSLQSQWPLIHAPCMVAAQYVKIVNKLVDRGVSTSLGPDKLRLLQSLVAADTGTQVIGHSLLCEEGVRLLCRSCVDTASFYTMAELLLAADCVDTRQACIQRVEQYIDQHSLSAEVDGNFQALFCKTLHREKFVPNLARILEAKTKLYRSNRHLPACVGRFTLWLEDNATFIRRHASLSALALPVQAIVIQHWVHNAHTSEHKKEVSLWCDQVWEYSRVTNATNRQAAAIALIIAGPGLLRLGSQAVNWMQPCVVQLMSACLTLIQDEDTDIRLKAADFVASLQWNGKPVSYASLHSNVGYNVFLSYISDNYWQSVDVVHLLIRLLYTVGDLEKSVRNKTNSRLLQLFDQEDNSFFAEQIYNSMSVHRTLQTVVCKCQAVSQEQSLHPLFQLSTSMYNDLEYLQSMMNAIETDSVINVCTDNSVLASMSGLVLLSDVAVSAGGQTGSGDLRCKLQSLVQMPVWPPALKRLWLSALACSGD